MDPEYFHLLAIMNITAINMGVQIPFLDPVFNSSWYILWTLEKISYQEGLLLANWAQT